MQDRFKFRMWDSFANKYFDEETDLLFENVYECLKQQIFYNSGNPLYGKLAYNHAKDGRIFEQCTGLKDKNGKLIYEGDIIRRYVGLGKHGSQKTKDIDVVKWSINGYVLENYCDYFADTDDFEVIGNIHENLDLLENKDE